MEVSGRSSKIAVTILESEKGLSASFPNMDIVVAVLVEEIKS